ncbi:MAG: extracellular solute-binding protein [Oscillospiraceae bacterium]|nr:extracellular solute-binding protein [Oscillospiraceae bacterium]
MKKTIATIILLALILGMIIACGNNSSNEVKDTTTIGGESTEEVKFTLPEYDFNGYKFNILTAAEQWIHHYAAERETGDIVNDAAYARNRAVEELYNINLNYQVYNGYSAGKEAVATALRGAVLADTGEFDLAIINVAYITGRILEGLFMDINTVDTIDPENPWWFDKINNEIAVANKLYTIAGSYSLMWITNASCLYFNKKLINDFELESPYELVNSGKWTFDKMVELGSQVCADLNGDGIYDLEDRYGIFSVGSESLSSMRYAMGTKITHLDSEGYPVLDGASEKMVTVYDKFRALYQNKELYYGEYGLDFDGQSAMFSDNKILFLAHTIRLAENPIMRDFEDYGIIPQPKFDEIQDSYYANCFGDGYSIPKLVNDENMSGAVLEALNRESYLNVVPSYYDIALQRKYTRDDESSAMLDIIRDNCIVDFGGMFYVELTYELWCIHALIFNNTDYTTWWASNEAAIQKNMEKLIEQLKELQ